MDFLGTALDFYRNSLQVRHLGLFENGLRQSLDVDFLSDHELVVLHALAPLLCRELNLLTADFRNWGCLH